MGKRLLAAAVCGALLCVILLLMGAVLPGLRRPLLILMYHDLVPDGAPTNGMTVTVGRFRADLETLRAHGYTAVLPRELAARGLLPEKPVLITFDDGYVSNYTLLLPILRETGMKAAVAVIGRGVDAYDDEFLNWDQCREMYNSGLVEFGSHSYDLHNLDERKGLYVTGSANGLRHLADETREAYAARLAADLDKSVERLEAELGAPVTYFAYPFGETDAWAETLIWERFALTLTVQNGTANLTRGLYGLPRRTITMERGADYYCW